jgi:hypothetical protein
MRRETSGPIGACCIHVKFWKEPNLVGTFEMEDLNLLVLKRHRNESIRIGDAVVTIIEGGPVTLGIEAPPHVHIVRTELEKAGPWRDWQDLGEADEHDNRML